MIIFISVLSFLLDGILSRYILPNSIFLPLFTIVSLVLIYPYFNNNNARYFKYSAILGLLYDITYTNTIFFNFFVFIIVAFVVGLLNYLLSNNWYVNIFITVISICVYRMINYLFFVFFKNQQFSFSVLCKSIYSSLLLNIIYFVILYLLTELYSNKKKILRSK